LAPSASVPTLGTFLGVQKQHFGSIVFNPPAVTSAARSILTLHTAFTNEAKKASA